MVSEMRHCESWPVLSPLALPTLKNGVNKTQQLRQKALSIIVFYKDHSTPTSKDSNVQ